MVQLTVDNHYPIDLDHLPRSWAATYVGDVIRDIRSGFSSGSYNRDGRGVVHLRPMNIDRLGRIVLSDVKYVTTENALRVTRGDVLFNNTNSAELVGKTAAILEEADWAFSNHMTRLRPPSGISHRFVAYQFYYLWLAGYFRFRSTQHVNQASISIGTLNRTIPLVIAPYNEQLRIVAVLEKQFGRLDETEASLANTTSKLETYRRAVLRQAVEGTLVPNEAELAQQQNRDYESGRQLLERIHTEASQPKQLDFLGNADPIQRGRPVKKHNEKLDLPEMSNIPAGWVWVRVKHVGEVMLGRQRAPKHQSGQHLRPYLRVANVFEDRIDTSDILQMNFTPKEYEAYHLSAGDILLNEGQSIELVGRPAMYRNEVPGVCFQNTLIRFRAKPSILPEFALLVFRHYLHSKRFQKVAKWSTNIAHLGASRFSEMEFPLPPIAEQKRIITEAERCLSIADKQEATIQAVCGRTARLRRGLLRNALSGKLVAQDPSDVPASALVEQLRTTNQISDKQRPKERAQNRSGRRPSMRLRRSLFEVLRNSQNDLKSEDLFRESGISEDLVEEFFLELRREIRNGRIIERRDFNANDIYLTLRDAQP